VCECDCDYDYDCVCGGRCESVSPGTLQIYNEYIFLPCSTTIESSSMQFALLYT